MTFESPADFNLFYAGDTHEGNEAFSVSAFNKFASIFFSEYENIPQNKNRFIHMGDPADFIARNDPRHDPEIHKTSVLKQFDKIQKRYEPFVSQMIGMLDSNHPLTLYPLGNMTEWLCEHLKTPYLTYSARLTFLDKNPPKTANPLLFKTYATHGHKTISSTADDEIRNIANQQLILKRHLKRMASDCAVMVKGHAHKLIVAAPTPRLGMTDTPDRKKLKQFYPKPTDYHKLAYIPWEMRWYGCSASFLRTFLEGYNTYSEKGEYSPVDMGFLVLIVRDKKIQELRPIAL
jgi:hypothetical protein